MTQPDDTLTRTRLEQPANALSPMEVRPLGREIEVRDGQSTKAATPMEVKPSGREIEARDWQTPKAATPMEVMAGRATKRREPQP